MLSTLKRFIKVCTSNTFILKIQSDILVEVYAEGGLC